MSPWPQARGAVNPILVALLLLLPASLASASDIPQSARASSLGMPPIMVRDIALTFEFPELAVDFPGQVFVVGVNQFGQNGVGGVARTGSQSFYALSHSLTELGVQFSPVANLSGDEGRAFHIGWAQRLGGARVGIAFRGGAQSVDRHFSFVGPPPTETVSEGRFQVTEAALGIGGGGERASVDLALTLRDTESEREDVLMTADTVTSRARQETEVDPSFGFSGRVTLAFGENLELLTVGSWTSDDMELVTSQEVLSPVIDSRPMTGERWQAGASLTGDSDALGRVSAFGHFRRDRMQAHGFGAGSVSTGELTVDLAKLGVSLEREMFENFRALAGVRVERLDQEVEFQSGPIGALPVTTDAFGRETTSDFFTWGIAYVWKSLELVGAVETRFDFDQLILSLDASFSF